MSEPGDIQVRRTAYKENIKYIWVICPRCNEGRWVTLSSTKRPNYTGACAKCFRDASRRVMMETREKLRASLSLSP